MSEEELHKLWIDKGQGMTALKAVYDQGKAEANKVITPTIREIHDGVFQQGIDIGIEMSAKAFGYIYDGDCENCPAESECEFGKPCIETLKEYIKNFNKENK